MILEELRDSIKKNMWLSVIIILLFSVGLSLLNIGLVGIETMYFQKDAFTTIYEDQNLYKLIDNYYGDDEFRFSKENDNLQRLKFFYDELVISKYWEYLEMSFQSIRIKNFKGSDKFFYGYESGRPSETVTLYGHDYDNAKAMQLSESTILAFDLELEEGEIFKERDYIYDSTNSIPAILGYEYTETYSIGDQLEIDYLGMQETIRICGFWKKDSRIIEQGNLTYLDRYIVIPSLIFENVPKDSVEKLFQYRIYLFKTNGTIMTQDLSANETQSIINNLCKRSNLLNYTVIGANNVNLDILNLQANWFIMLTIIISIIIFIFSIISLVLSISTKIKNNLKAYSIHLISGASIKDIKKYIIYEIILYMISANLLAIFISTIVLGYFRYNVILFISVLLVLLCLITPLKMIDKINIPTLLRRKK